MKCMAIVLVKKIKKTLSVLLVLLYLLVCFFTIEQKVVGL